MLPPAPTLHCAEYLIAGHSRLRRSAAWGFGAALVLAVPAGAFAARSWSPWCGIPAAFIAVLTLVRYLRGRDRLYRALRCPVCGSGDGSGTGNGQLLWGARAVYDCRDCKKLSPTDCRISRHHTRPVNIGPACGSSPAASRPIATSSPSVRSRRRIASPRMPHPALPAPPPPPLHRSPLFWGGLLIVVFLLFAWVMSWRHLARATRDPASICSWQSAVSLTHREVHREVHPNPFISRWVLDSHPGPAASRWAWEFLQPPADDAFPSLFPPPRWSVSYIYWNGRQFVSGTQEHYHFLDRSLTLPYWLLLAIVTPLWLLGLHLARRRFRRGAAAAAALPPS